MRWPDRSGMNPGIRSLSKPRNAMNGRSRPFEARPPDAASPRGSGGQARQPVGHPDPIIQLINITKALKYDEVERIRNLVERIAIKGDSKAAAKLIKRFAPAFYRQQLAPDLFLSREDDFQGEFLLGHKPDGREFGLGRQELVRHVFLSGQSGAGKTSLLKAIHKQAQERAVHSVYWDRKSDMDHLVREGFDAFWWPHLRINPLCPPSNLVNIFEWRNDASKAFSELHQFLARGSSLFMLGLDQLYKNFDVYSRWPNWDWF